MKKLVLHIIALIVANINRGNIVVMILQPLFLEASAAMKECPWTRKICKQLTTLGAEVKVEYAGSRYVASGWPDRFICHTVWMGWLEFKGDNTRVTDLQRERMKRLWERQPGSVYVVRHGYDANYIQLYNGDTVAKWLSVEEMLLELRRLHNLHFVDREIISDRAIAALKARTGI